MPKFTGEASRSFEPVPEGDYDLTITAITRKMASDRAKHPGAEMWHVAYEIGDTGKKVFSNLVFVPETNWRISNWWRALGHEVVPGKELDTGEPEEHFGAQLKAHLSIVDYNGDKQNEIQYYIEPRPGDAVKEPRAIPF